MACQRGLPGAVSPKNSYIFAFLDFQRDLPQRRTWALGSCPGAFGQLVLIGNMIDGDQGLHTHQYRGPHAAVNVDGCIIEPH